MAAANQENEVFLSFRGPDTRQGLTNVLKNKLEEKGVRVFYDDKSISKGEEITEALKRGTEKCQIYVPILSEDYASSKACLLELALMMKYRDASNGRKQVCPIFCHVKVEDVKLKTERYKNDLGKHNVDEVIVKEWEQALKDVAKIKGWELKDTGIDDFGKIVVKDILDILETKHLTLPPTLLEWKIK